MGIFHAYVPLRSATECKRAAFFTIAGTTEYSEDKKMLDGYTMDVLEQRIGYCFHNKALLKQALTHSSYTNEQKINKTENYERIEFLGDAVLELVSSDFLFREHPDVPEGELTKMRASMVCEPSLAFCARTG